MITTLIISFALAVCAFFLGWKIAKNKYQHLGYFPKYPFDKKNNVMPPMAFGDKDGNDSLNCFTGAILTFQNDRPATEPKGDK